jgi:teichuronic acid exporter
MARCCVPWMEVLCGLASKILGTKTQMKSLIDKLKQKLSSKFVQNVGWMGASQLVNRVFRLATTVVSAQFLSEEDFGLLAIVLTINEFVLVFTRTGIGEKLTQAKEEDIEVYSRTVYWLTWVISTIFFVAQCAIAFPIAWFYGNDRLIPICFLGITYLITAVSEVQAGLIQRENRLHIFAISNSVGNMATNSLCVILLFAGLGMWAMIIPQVVLAPIWVVINLKYHPWRITGAFTLHRWQEIINYSKNLMAVELLATLRANIDYLLIAKFLTFKELGLYYFAFNAGIGLSLNVISTLNEPLFPYLCSARGNPPLLKKYYMEAIKTIAIVALPIMLLQASLAPFYVPIIFGTKWIPAIPILVLICLSAIPRPFASASSRLLWAVDKPQFDLYWNVIFTILLAIVILIGLHWGVLGVGFAVFLVHAIALPIFTIWSSRYGLKLASEV